MVAEGAILGGDGCDGTENLVPDTVYETTLRAGAGWGATTVDLGVNYDGNVGKGECGVSGVSKADGAGMA